MSRARDLLVAWALCLWVGGTWVVGYLATPALFGYLADRRLAGELAGILFQRLGWLGLLCGALILIAFLVPQRVAGRRRWLFPAAILLMLACTAANLFYIQPVIAGLKAAGWPKPELAGNSGDLFARWHAVSAIVYLLQSLAGLVAVGWWATRPVDSEGGT